MSKRVWLTWENQPRNKELAQAFGCDYGCLVNQGEHGIKRYVLSTVRTLALLWRGHYRTLFAQCPSLILCLVVAFYSIVTRKAFIIDCHNIVLDQADASKVVRLLVWLVFKCSDYVIVSNATLMPRVEALGGRTMILPDKLPHVIAGELPLAFSSHKRPLITFICSFASDEPISEFLDAALKVDHDFTLFVTGKQASAERLGLLKYEGSKVVFTDYLDKADYDALIFNSDLLVVLTTRDDCLVCGAYEALSIETPAILSDTPVLRECFSSGFYYTNNNTQDFMSTLESALASEFYRGRVEKISADKRLYIDNWNKIFSENNHKINEI